MSKNLSGTSYKEFLKKQVEPQPPTPAEVEMALNNKSSRADPPKDLPSGS